jgi:HNH endonuclease
MYTPACHISWWGQAVEWVFQDGEWWNIKTDGHRSRGTVRTCEVCGIEFPALTGRLRRYCSRACTGKAKLGQAVNFQGYAHWKLEDDGWWYYTHPERRARGELRTCEQCGKSYPGLPTRGRRFCGKSCAGKAVSPFGRPAEASMHWRGGRRVSRGYVLVYAKDHSSLVGTKRSYVLEHRLVMEEELGRPLYDYEQVHHKNGIKTDNRPENLELWTRAQPKGGRNGETVLCCLDCGSRNIGYGNP